LRSNTSVVSTKTFDWPLGADHAATEEALAASTVPHVVVRNNWYIENSVGDVLRAAETGVIAAAIGDAPVARTSRRDFAEGAAVVLIEDGHLGQVYEFGADAATTHDELAAAASEVLGREVTYQRLTDDELLAGLAAAGLDEGTAGFVASIDAGIAAGVLADTDGTLSRLIGHPTISLVDGLRAAVDAARVSA
jgi:NAD(P)H dehydrogenase (quinone)